MTRVVGAANQDQAPEVQGERDPSAPDPRRTKAKRPKAKANESQVNEGQGKREPSVTESQVRTLILYEGQIDFLYSK